MNRVLIRILVGTALIVGCPGVFGQESPVKAYGSYWNVRSDGEHASGYSLDLWKQGQKFLGIVRIHSGLIGDPRAGLLENVVYDPHTGKLSFSAQTDWVRGFANGEIVEFPLIYKFDGKVVRGRVTGVISQVGFRNTSKRVNLPRSKEWSGFQKDFQSLNLWQADVKPILDRNGPKRQELK